MARYSIYYCAIKTSTENLWFEPKNLKIVSTVPVSSAYKLTEEISTGNKTKNI